jgi:hypothetical protein
MVWAWNDQTKTPLLRPVVELFSRERDEVWEIRAGQDTLRVTGEHPFLLAGKGWTAAREIKEGDEMFTIDLWADLYVCHPAQEDSAPHGRALPSSERKRNKSRSSWRVR